MHELLDINPAIGLELPASVRQCGPVQMRIYLIRCRVSGDQVTAFRSQSAIWTVPDGAGQSLALASQN
jgi:hypothetical protein